MIQTDLLFWALARATGLASFMALGLSLATGIALRTSVLDWLGHNRAMRGVHELSTALWLPLGAAHVLTILGDQTARIAPRDLVVPFQVAYAPLAVGLGTLALDIFAVVAITSWLRRYLDQALWRWIHRLSYAAFAALFFHAALAGTDFSQPLVSAVAWSLAFALAILAIARVLWGRLPA